MMPPNDLMPARLVGGQFDGFAVTCQPGQEVIEMGGDYLVLFGGTAEQRKRLEGTKWRYCFVRFEEGEEGPAV